MTQDTLTTEQQEFENKKHQVIARLNEYKETYPDLVNHPAFILELIEYVENMIFNNMNVLVLDFFINKDDNYSENIKKEQIYMLIYNTRNLMHTLNMYNGAILAVVNKNFDEIKKLQGNKYEELNEEVQEIKDKLHSEINRFNKLDEVLKNEKTYEIYKNEERKYKIAYWSYIFASVILTSLGLYVSYYLMNMQKVLEESAKIPVYDYWFLKIAIVLVGITAITFCLKQAIHYQKKRDLAEKNRLELEALPTYMTYFNDEMKTEIYKELLPKYFGQPIDNTHYTNMNSLIDEQLKLSNEILKSQLNKIGANSDSSTESKSKSSNP